MPQPQHYSGLKFPPPKKFIHHLMYRPDWFHTQTKSLPSSARIKGACHSSCSLPRYLPLAKFLGQRQKIASILLKYHKSGLSSSFHSLHCLQRCLLGSYLSGKLISAYGVQLFGCLPYSSETQHGLVLHRNRACAVLVSSLVIW